ncbi:AFG1-like ATPase [Gonapodya prolifera JEL478]|uniref:AFG1-like ATPase n=1 Tax=Gonapodya prolifera (strain JEL478) TaxID=1344416 RepID=A0A139AYI4_GONPJ|nr:AFG1-like ATPase [Gonapodya prolifera JEL478]|eukprot:KXS21808.1 AFG1-like ATPase [Gonapodya prolifera JEL478]
MSRSLLSAYLELIAKARLTRDLNQIELVSRLQRVSDDLQSNRRGLGLYIHGPVGTGKTLLMDLWHHNVGQHHGSLRKHFHVFMRETHSQLHDLNVKTRWTTSDPLVTIGTDLAQRNAILCLDEFQVHDIADAMILRRLFEAFFSSGGTLLATSNRPPERLYELGLNRRLFLPFIDTLKKNCEVFQVKSSNDYRVSVTRATASHNFSTDSAYFAPSSDPTIRSHFFGAWALATGGQEPLPLTLNLPGVGRTLAVPKSVTSPFGSACLMTFDELCGQPRAAIDYIALCRHFHGTSNSGIYISDLVLLRDTMFDETRRFITLVDVAYEERCPLYILSEGSIEDVFRGIQETKASEGKEKELRVAKEGGASSSMMATYIGEMEWSATGLKASMADGGAGVSDVRFSIARAQSRLTEMQTEKWRNVERFTRI